MYVVFVLMYRKVRNNAYTLESGNELDIDDNLMCVKWYKKHTKSILFLQTVTVSL